jgi:hypothetical protein|tara:strand:- start:658 stop:804 length:147 start_codon:yes stop_codon:yes gene_type:complete
MRVSRGGNRQVRPAHLHVKHHHSYLGNIQEQIGPESITDYAPRGRSRP